MAATNFPSSNPTDFSEPWKFSDVVLVVEDQRFHVHRSTLAFWSPVFERMFMSEFKEKNNDEIPLPGKKASEIKQLLQMMYPSLEEKVVTESSCYFLFELAHEYQIESIAQKCEAIMVSMVEAKTEDDVLSALVYGQNYQMKTLISTCIHEARRLTLKELKQHHKRDEIEPDNYLQIAEGIIQRLEEQCKVAKEDGLKSVANLSRYLYVHAKPKGRMTLPFSNVKLNTSEYLTRLQYDIDKLANCGSLCNSAVELISLKKVLETLP